VPRKNTGNPEGMTDQQWKFAQMVKADPERNATKAYLAVYSSCKSEESAAAAASRLLSSVKVKAYLDKSVKKAMKKFDITEERILQELACIAFLDFAELLTEDGNMKDIKDIPEHARRAIAGLELSELFDGEGDERRMAGILKKIKTSDKKGALELLGKSLKMWTDKVEVEMPTVRVKDFTGENA